MGGIQSEEVTVLTPSAEAAGTQQRSEKARSAHLIVLSGANVGQVFKIAKREMVIGRDDDVDIQILDAGISRRHARVSTDGEGNFFLEDAGSRNGTFTNN